MEIKIIIIEDEELAISRLKRLLSNLQDSFEVVTEIRNVKDAIHWFSKHPSEKIDLIFSDIQLTDGISFEIFQSINFSVPIIFTTAFDEYLMKAFKTYGIEYLLKPFSSEDLDMAVQKYKNIVQTNRHEDQAENIYKAFLNNFRQHEFPTFVSYSRDKIFPVRSEDIAYFNLDNQTVYAHTIQSKWAMNENLNQIQEKLPPYHFYRANRQCIIQRKFINEIENYFGGRLKIKLTMPHEEILISKDNCKGFKDWLQA